MNSEGKPLQTARPTQPAPATPSTPEPAVYDFERPAPAAPPSAAQNLGIAPPVAAGAQAEAAPARDLSAELSSALNQMTDCVDAAQAAQQPSGRLVVSVSAYVMGTGTISRATIDAPGQPAEALACLQRRVLAAKLREPVVGAPINVKGSAEVEVKAAGPRPAAAIPPAPTAPPANVARGEPGAEIARPDQSDLAGPP